MLEQEEFMHDLAGGYFCGFVALAGTVTINQGRKEWGVDYFEGKFFGLAVASATIASTIWYQSLVSIQPEDETDFVTQALVCGFVPRRDSALYWERSVAQIDCYTGQSF